MEVVLNSAGINTCTAQDMSCSNINSDTQLFSTWSTSAIFGTHLAEKNKDMLSRRYRDYSYASFHPKNWSHQMRKNLQKAKKVSHNAIDKTRQHKCHSRRLWFNKRVACMTRVKPHLVHIRPQCLQRLYIRLIGAHCAELLTKWGHRRL
jgi:hypothetical protein